MFAMQRLAVLTKLVVDKAAKAVAFDRLASDLFGDDCSSTKAGSREQGAGNRLGWCRGVHYCNVVAMEAAATLEEGVKFSAGEAVAFFQHTT